MKTSETKTCRYCGCEREKKDVCREGRDNCLAYSCKDVEACGQRIREQTETRHDDLPEVAGIDDLPF